MDANVGPLLLLVQANICAQHEDQFNSWYYHHVPKLLEIPGWLWGRRYVCVKGETKYLALYEWEGAHCLNTLANPKKMLPAAQAKLANWHAYGLPLATNTAWNVYKPVAHHISFRASLA